jgi:hypothetical protein
VALSENVFPCNPRIGDQICVSAVRLSLCVSDISVPMNSRGIGAEF